MGSTPSKTKQRIKKELENKHTSVNKLNLASKWIRENPNHITVEDLVSWKILYNLQDRPGPSIELIHTYLTHPILVTEVDARREWAMKEIQYLVDFTDSYTASVLDFIHTIGPNYIVDCNGYYQGISLPIAWLAQTSKTFEAIRKIGADFDHIYNNRSFASYLVEHSIHSNYRCQQAQDMIIKYKLPLCLGEKKTVLSYIRYTLDEDGHNLMWFHDWLISHFPAKFLNGDNIGSLVQNQALGHSIGSKSHVKLMDTVPMEKWNCDTRYILEAIRPQLFTVWKCTIGNSQYKLISFQLGEKPYYVEPHEIEALEKCAPNIDDSRKVIREFVRCFGTSGYEVSDKVWYALGNPTDKSSANFTKIMLAISAIDDTGEDRIVTMKAESSWCGNCGEIADTICIPCGCTGTICIQCTESSKTWVCTCGSNISQIIDLSERKPGVRIPEISVSV